MADVAIRMEFTEDAARVLSAFKGMPEAAQRGVLAGVGRGLLLTETRVRQSAGVKWRRGAAGLSGRLTSYSMIRNGEIDGAIGFRKTRRFPYELSQEFGAQGPMAVPLTPLARGASDRGIGPRQLGVELTMVKRPGKPPILVEHRDSQRGWYKGMKTIVHYVIIGGLKPRLRFRETVQAAMPDLSGEIVDGFRKGVYGS